MAQGKTFADVFDSIIDQPRRIIGLVAVLLCLCMAVVIGVFAVAAVLGIRRGQIQELQLSPTGAHVLVRAGDNDPGQYLLVVHPHGWQRVDVDVRANDTLRFASDGSVNVDLSGIMRVADNRQTLEAEIAQKEQLDRSSRDRAAVPERFYGKYLTPERRESITLLRRWTGPDGVLDETVPAGSFGGRVAKRVIPTERLGALIGAVIPRTKMAPDRSDAFRIGRRGEIVAPIDGTLWLSVNDVWDDDDAEYPGKFYDDNLGFYWVTLQTTRP